MTIHPFSPQGRANLDWHVSHKIACAAVHRGVHERGEDITRAGLKRDMPDLELNIRRHVEMCSVRSLERMVCRDIALNGPLVGGWGLRWERTILTRQAPPTPPPCLDPEEEVGESPGQP